MLSSRWGMEKKTGLLTGLWRTPGAGCGAWMGKEAPALPAPPRPARTRWKGSPVRAGQSTHPPQPPGRPLKCRSRFMLWEEAGEIIPASAETETWLCKPVVGWLVRAEPQLRPAGVSRGSASTAELPYRWRAPCLLCGYRAREEQVVPGVSFHSSSASISSCKGNFWESGANSASLWCKGDGE